MSIYVPSTSKANFWLEYSWVLEYSSHPFFNSNDRLKIGDWCFISQYLDINPSTKVLGGRNGKNSWVVTISCWIHIWTHISILDPRTKDGPTSKGYWMLLHGYTVIWPNTTAYAQWNNMLLFNGQWLCMPSGWEPDKTVSMETVLFGLQIEGRVSDSANIYPCGSTFGWYLAPLATQWPL